MILLDVNVLVYAHRSDLVHHVSSKRFVEDLIAGAMRFGTPEIVLRSVARIVTQLKPTPTPMGLAFDFCNVIRNAPGFQNIYPTERHWPIFERLCRSGPLSGKVVADAYLASFAIDRDDEWITYDSDFARFAGLRWRSPEMTQPRINPL